MTSQASLGLPGVAPGLARRLVIALMVWGCSALAVAQPYVEDAGFNSGNWYVDAFAGSATQSYFGRKILRLDNGDVVVAGIVPSLSANGPQSLGLVRYNSAGQRQTWAAPGESGHNANQYVIYSVPFGGTEDVLDLVRYGERLFVLVHGLKYRFVTQPPFGSQFAGHTVEVLVFGTDGAFQRRQVVHEDDDTSARTVIGGGLVVFQNDLSQFNSPVSLVYGGTQIDNGLYRAAIRRYSVATDSALTDATGLVYPNPGGNGCNAGCEIRGLRTGSRPGTGIPRIYAAGSRYSGNNWDIAVMQLSASGVPSGSFSADGMQVIPFNLAGGSLNDGGRALAVEASGSIGANNDRIYVAADVAVHCGNAAGVVKLRGNGEPDTSFGPGGLGRYYFGGPQVPAGNICASPSADAYAHAIAVADGKVALAGQRNIESFFIGAEQQVDGLLAVMDSDGSMQSLDWYPYREGGQRRRHSGFWGVTASGDASFSVTGDVRYLADAAGGLAGKMQYATLRLAPQSDAIFANGYQAP